MDQSGSKAQGHEPTHQSVSLACDAEELYNYEAVIRLS